MAQDAIYETAESQGNVETEAPDALTVCRGCGHLVPKTMLCLWCGSPILFRMPREREPQA